MTEETSIQNKELRRKKIIINHRITAFDILVALILLSSTIISSCSVVPAVSGIIPETIATKTRSPQLSGPEAARDVAFKFVQANYGQVVPTSITEWVDGEVLSGELIGGTIYQFAAGDWTAKVVYPLVPQNTTFYTVKIEGGAYGLIWEGLIDPVGQVATTSISVENFEPTPTGTPTTFPGTISPTTIPPTLTPTPMLYCDWMAFVKDMTIPDGIILKPGETFIKTWRLKNQGDCTWTPDYTLVFSSGSQMGDTVAVKLSDYVAPGNTVDVSVELTAPTKPGNYRGYWMLQNSSGIRFGYGENANKAFYVDIQTINNSYGSVSGSICYPGEHIPHLNLYFTNMTRNKRMEIPTFENQNTYHVQLEPGEYLAYAWTLNFELAGGYTDVEHRLKPFEVRAGETLPGIDICDWYTESGTIHPPSPDHLGTISGNLSFPSEQIPPLRIVAFDINNNSYQWVDTITNQQTYEIESLMPGYYTIIAYEKNSGFAGGYSEYAKCGLTSDCVEDHNLVTIYIAPGDYITKVDPADWYAPAGTYPEDPTR